MRELVEIAKRYDIPMPPRDARLVLAHTGWTTVLGNSSTSRDPGIYSPAFLISEKGGTTTVMRGAVRETVQERRGPKIRHFVLEKELREPGGYIPAFDRVSTFFCAVQLAERGEIRLAESLWKKGHAKKRIGDFYGYEDPRPYWNDPAKLLARCIYEHLENEAARAPQHWPRIASSIKRLFEEYPFLVKSDPTDFHDAAKLRREFLADLTSAVEAQPPKPDSVEALLLEWSRIPSDMRHLGFFRDVEEDSKADAPAEEILLRGLSAVPELIALSDDRRMTVHKVPQVMNSVPRVKRVGELAGDLLRELAGGQASSGLGNREPKETKQYWTEWWRANQDKPEKEILAKSAFVMAGDRITGIKHVPAMIFAERYPEELGPLIATYLEEAGDSAQPFGLAEAIFRSQLPKTKQVELLVALLDRKDYEHKRFVLQVMAKVDGAKCAELAGPVIDKLPTGGNSWTWSRTPASYTHVVMLLDDDAIWKRYLAFAKKSGAALRLETMNAMNNSDIRDRSRNRRLAYLASFLGDQEIRDLDLDRMLTGPVAGFKFPKIAVRDFAAMQIASIFEFGDKPDEFWIAEQWTELREKVQLALKSRKLPDFSK